MRLLLLFGVLLAACDGGFVLYAPTPKGLVARGKELFEARGLGAIPYSCSDCHIDTPEGEGPPSLTPAHTLYDSASRGSWYGGRFKTRVVQGAQLCLTERMKGTPLSGDD